MTPTGNPMAIEGIHVKESPIGSFNLLVVYNMTSLTPPLAQPWKLLVDEPQALLFLTLVFNSSDIMVVGPITVTKVGLTSSIKVAGTDLTIRALTPVKPLKLTFHFENKTTLHAIDITAVHFPASATGTVKLNMISLQGSLLQFLPQAFLIPEARIELGPIQPGNP